MTITQHTCQASTGFHWLLQNRTFLNVNVWTEKERGGEREKERFVTYLWFLQGKLRLDKKWHVAKQLNNLLFRNDKQKHTHKINNKTSTNTEKEIETKRCVESPLTWPSGNMTGRCDTHTYRHTHWQQPALTMTSPMSSTEMSLTIWSEQFI